MRPLADQSPLSPSCALTAADRQSTKEQRAELILWCHCQGCRTARLIASLAFFASASAIGLFRQERS